MTTQTTTTVHQGLSADEIALLESGELDTDGTPKEDETDRLRAKVLADELSEGDALAGVEPERMRDKEGSNPQGTEAETAPAASAPAQAADVAVESAAVDASPATEPQLDVPKSARPPKYEVGDPEKMDERLKELDEQQSQALGKLMEGEIDQAEYQRVIATARKEERDIVASKALHHANVQNEKALQEADIKALAVKAKADGIDYAADGQARRQFDIALSLAADDAENAGKPFAELIGQAHRAVLAHRGKLVPQAPAPAAASVAASATPGSERSVDKSKIPPTLSRVPPAADPAISGDEFAHLVNLQGVDLERAFAKLTPEQQERYLD